MEFIDLTKLEEDVELDFVGAVTTFPECGECPCSLKRRNKIYKTYINIQFHDNRPDSLTDNNCHHYCQVRVIDRYNEDIYHNDATKGSSPHCLKLHLECVWTIYES